MAKAKKKPEPQKERTPSVLNLNRFVSEDDNQRAADAMQANPEKREEIKEAFSDEMTARILAMPETRAARVIQRFDGDTLDINAEVEELRRLTAKVNNGDMSTPEAVLVSQAHTLDALFSTLAIRSHSNMKEGYLDASDRYMRLALKAQAQSAKTIQILAEIKNPRPVAFVKQANIAHNQQINQTVAGGSFETSTRSHTCVGNSETAPSKLSGETYELLENTRAQSLEGGNGQALETVGALDRATHGRG